MTGLDTSVRHNDPNGLLPIGADVCEDHSMNDTTMTTEQAVAYLCRDGGRVPCSRYGRNSAECAPVAVAVAEIIADANGEPLTEDAVDYAMGLVVNDHDDVLSLILEYGTPEQRELVADVTA